MFYKTVFFQMTYAFIALPHSFILLCKDNVVKQIDVRSICKSNIIENIGTSFIYLFIYIFFKHFNILKY